MRFLNCFSLAAALAAATPAFAADDMKGMDHSSHMEKTSSAPSTKAFEAADMAMHKSMKRAYTGDADKDFLSGMIPHHQGAIDMAKVVLEYGKDPKVKALAEKIIADQQREIADMKAMLAAAR